MSLLFLCFSNENMEFMLEHETLMSTVSRTLRDEFKKSLELTLYLLNIFQAYSNFTQFHEFLLTVLDFLLSTLESNRRHYYEDSRARDQALRRPCKGVQAKIDGVYSFSSFYITFFPSIKSIRFSLIRRDGAVYAQGGKETSSYGS